MTKYISNHFTIETDLCHSRKTHHRNPYQLRTTTRISPQTYRKQRPPNRLASLETVKIVKGLPDLGLPSD